MNSSGKTTTVKSNRKRALLPLIALVVGLSLPAVALANECMGYCVNGCVVTYYSELPGCAINDQVCIDQAIARMYQCFNQCYGYCGM